MITYDRKIDRARNTLTGRFVSFKKARLSSTFRVEYEPVMLKKKVRDLEKGLIEKEELIEQLKDRAIPKKEWVKVIPPAELLSPLMMYTELHVSLSKYKYRKILAEVNKQDTSNKKLRVLMRLYNEKLGIR